MEHKTNSNLVLKQNRRMRNHETKRYYCEKCDVSFDEAYCLKRHCKGIKHNPENKKLYSCPTCPEFTTNIKTAFETHLTRTKHIRRIPMAELLGLKNYFDE